MMGNNVRKRQRRAEIESVRQSAREAFAAGKSRESNPWNPRLSSNHGQWQNAWDWEQQLYQEREDELATRAAEEQMLAQREADFKAGFSEAWSMGGYGDYSANEQSAWNEYAKDQGL